MKRPGLEPTPRMQKQMVEHLTGYPDEDGKRVEMPDGAVTLGLAFDGHDSIADRTPGSGNRPLSTIVDQDQGDYTHKWQGRADEFAAWRGPKGRVKTLPDIRKDKLAERFKRVGLGKHTPGTARRTTGVDVIDHRPSKFPRAWAWVLGQFATAAEEVADRREDDARLTVDAVTRDTVHASFRKFGKDGGELAKAEALLDEEREAEEVAAAAREGRKPDFKPPKRSVPYPGSRRQEGIVKTVRKVGDKRIVAIGERKGVNRAADREVNSGTPRALNNQRLVRNRSAELTHHRHHAEDRLVEIVEREIDRVQPAADRAWSLRRRADRAAAEAEEAKIQRRLREMT